MRPVYERLHYDNIESIALLEELNQLPIEKIKSVLLEVIKMIPNPEIHGHIKDLPFSLSKLDNLTGEEIDKFLGDENEMA